MSTAPAIQPKAAALLWPRPLIFLHIPKAAGTTLQEIIVRHYMRGKIFRFTGSQEQWKAFCDGPAEDRGRYDLIAGHVHFGIHELLPDPATYITMLRDPIDRVVSHYHFVLANPGHYLHPVLAGGRYTLHDYAVTRVSHELDNDQVRWLCARDHFDVPVGEVSREMVEEAKWNLANAISVFGLVERFSDSLRCLRAAFGWDEVKLPEKRNANRHRPTLDRIAPETIAAIREINRHDCELYDFACGLFEEQLVRLGVPPVEHLTTV